ncbi:hypothetical protein AB0F72_09340 [Actinoplanes sp. NPDC023936]|uniref:hypothetical protein n=1 Tax=Actinoplanes sp. NPDC023936 TaxID=3154910 RepID=UPI0033C46FED
MTNRLDREQLRQDVRDANYAGRRTAPSAIAWIAALVGVVAVIALVAYGVKVAFAPAKGAGDTVRQNEDVNNRVAQQRAFVNLHEGVQADDLKIQVLADAAAANPADPKAKTDLQGTQLICLGRVADYNAKVQETLAAKWLPADLPARLGADPSTDCKPNTVPSPAAS